MRTYKQELQHLYKSDFIRSFAEIDLVTGKYKRDINDADKKPFYLCDGKACGENHNCGECSHTTDITHAKNFHYDGHNGYWEQSETVKDGCPFTDITDCTYYPDGCGKCTYNNP